MISFTSLLIVGAVAVAVPLFLGLVPAVKVPAVVLEILGGILVGPTVLGWVHLDVAVRVIADLGLGFLLFMAGFEIDLRRFDRRMLNLVGRAFVLSVVLALLFAYGLRLGGEVRDGLLVGITLMATSLGVLVPILNDADQTRDELRSSDHGRGFAGRTRSACPVVGVLLGFVEEPGVELGLLAGFVGLTAAIVVVTQRVRVWGPLREVVHRLENTSSQLRVRLAITFALAFSAVAEHFGLATILGAFLAGVIVRRTDESPASQEEFQGKLEAIGFGFLIPVFFVSTGVGLDITSLFHSTRAIILVPIFLVALLVVRGLPALLYVRVVGRTRAIAAGFMQATSLTFIVVATVIGVQTGHQRTSTAAALVVAGLLSVVIYPPVALRMLKSAAESPGVTAPAPEPDPS